MHCMESGLFCARLSIPAFAFFVAKQIMAATEENHVKSDEEIPYEASAAW